MGGGFSSYRGSPRRLSPGPRSALSRGLQARIGQNRALEHYNWIILSSGIIQDSVSKAQEIPLQPT